MFGTTHLTGSGGTIHLLFISLYMYGSLAVDNFTSIPTAMNGELAVCPGDSFSLTCSHDNENPSAASTTWILPNVDQCVIIHSFASGTRDCGPFMLTNVSGNTESVLSSTLPTTAVNVPSGFVIMCLDGLNPDSPEIGNITIEIFNVSAPSFEVQQLSQGSLQVNTSADDTQCVALYQVDITQNGTSESFSANSSLVPVSGLDLCRYNYTLVGSTRSAGGVQSELSSAVSFSADLSVLNGVNNVRTNQDGSVLEWTQEANVNYPTCITGYIVEWNGMEYSTPSTSATREDLNRAGFPYCQNISVTITPFTPMETLTSRFSMSTVNLVTPGFVAATLSWVYISNDTAMMDGNQTVNMTIRFLGTVQEIADTIVPNRTYGVNCAGEMCTPNVPFTGSGFEAILPNNTSPGDVCTVCVTFTNTDCMRTVESNIIIPGFIVALANETITQSSYMGTFNMPITAYRPDQLSIISTVSPNDSAPVIADYPSSYQYILTFTGLNPGVNYNYTVRIVRRDNQAIQVHPLFPGSFLTVALPSTTTPMPSTAQTSQPVPVPETTGTGEPPVTGVPQGGCDSTCATIVAVVVVVAVILLLVIVVVVIVVYRFTKTGKMKVMSENEIQLTKQNDPEGDSQPPEPSADTPKNPEEDSSKPDSTNGAGASGGAENLIYADLDLATKGKKPAQPQVSTTSGGAAKEDEPIIYSTIDAAKTTKPDTEQSSNDQPSES